MDPDALARLLRRRVEDEPLEVPVSGPSMAGTIEAGSKVWVESQHQPNVGEVWVVVSDGAALVVHRVRQVHANEIVTRGSGNSLDDAPLARSRIVGRVRRCTSPEGKTRTFGTWDRRRAAVSFRLRRMVRRLGLLPR